eukprot:1145381-Pelagomonas_calceolata.AAC.3
MRWESAGPFFSCRAQAWHRPSVLTLRLFCSQTRQQGGCGLPRLPASTLLARKQACGVAHARV